MEFRSQYKNVSHSSEFNDGIRHPDFNDDVRTTVAEFIQAFANGTDLSRMVRKVEYDNNPSIDDNFDNIFDNPLGDKDIIDVHNSVAELQNATTTNDDANNNSSGELNFTAE